MSKNIRPWRHPLVPLPAPNGAIPKVVPACRERAHFSDFGVRTSFGPSAFAARHSAAAARRLRLSAFSVTRLSAIAFSEGGSRITHITVRPYHTFRDCKSAMSAMSVMSALFSKSIILLSKTARFWAQFLQHFSWIRAFSTFRVRRRPSGRRRPGLKTPNMIG
jgi:hypothetical protein